MDRRERLEASWDSNAENWTRAVRDGLIPSRKAGTDDAVVAAILSCQPKRMLDVGCGEGWLCRRIAAFGSCEVVGIDGTPRLVEEARRADPQNRYDVVSYRDLIAGKFTADGPFDAVVFNYALLEEQVVELLTAAKGLLSDSGAIIIQTLHPWVLSQGGEYRDSWQNEDFASFENQNWATMPWYFRRLSTWHDVIREAGLVIDRLEEPAETSGKLPLSLLMFCKDA